MREQPPPRVVVTAGRSGSRLLGDVERARHAEMHDQHLARGELGQEVLCPPFEPLHPLPLQALHEIAGQRPAQIAALRLDPSEARALHDWREPAANGLDFGQLGHSAGTPATDIASSTSRRYGPRPQRKLAMQRGRATADFGFRQVAVGDKQGLVDDVFRSVANRYDLMNDLMSGGLHRAWKDALVTAVNPPRARPAAAHEAKASARPFALLDLAGGTGDIAFRVVEAGGSGTRAAVVDINTDMLAVGRARAAERGLDDAIAFVEGNAEALPFPDRGYDAVTIAFGIRNVPRIAAALGEAYRVLRIGGRFLCLEFSTVDVPGLAALYDLYSFNLIPALGRAVTDDAEAYRYLVESIRRFPRPDAFADMMRAAGFARVSFQRMSAGIVALHSGWRL